MNKNLNFLIIFVFTVVSGVGFFYLSDILFIQIPADDFVTSHGYGLLVGFAICGFFIVIGCWSMMNQIKMRKFS